ncbi:MAG: cysteine--tRNA ligase [Bacteroidetes bacterium]|nr:cysteine--tRNA ligase [Bacteroidota bacterium]
MTIKIHNTLSGKKEELNSIEPGHVKIYVCGITSYDYCHIGHARSSLAFDMIVRYLRFRNYKVTYVRNFTDIDDKIIARANERNIPAQELANQFIDEFYTDMDKLGIDRPDIEPKATEEITEMVELINELIELNKAYESEGDVYYIVDSFKEYGKLSKRNIDDMKAGARISINEKKRNPMDFVLWKSSKPGEPAWESPWGSGRPGWHIECSAMSRKYLGETFDIHGGGQDLIFPHHENEIAQSEGANNKPFVNTWIHHGFVTIRDEKMSKSLGNFLTIRDILDNYHPEILRFFIFSTHYRNPLDFSESAMQDATTGLLRLYECVAAVDEISESTQDSEAESVINDKDLDQLSTMEERFCLAMDNDFNTAQAQGVLFDSAKAINRILGKLPSQPVSSDISVLKKTVSKLKQLADVMGLLRENGASFLADRRAESIDNAELDVALIENLIEERLQCRKNKNWARGDEIRDQLQAMNVDIQDGPGGTTWSVKNK